MNGRFFAGTQVVAYIADGVEKFRKSNDRKADIEEDEVDGTEEAVEEQRRLSKLGSWVNESAREAEVDDEA